MEMVLSEHSVWSSIRGLSCIIAYLLTYLLTDFDCCFLSSTTQQAKQLASGSLKPKTKKKDMMRWFLEDTPPGKHMSQSETNPNFPMCIHTY